VRVMAAGDIAARLRALFPCPVAVAAVPVGAGGGDLWPAEAVAMRNAVPSRRAEFTAGRAAARLAMASLGLPPAAIPMRVDRSPDWPEAISGSITHTDALALAAVAPSARLAAIGIDAEPDEPLAEDLAELVLRPEEKDLCAAESDPARAARLFFVAKEAAYKCQFALTGELLDFDGLSISVSPEGAVKAICTRQTGPWDAGASLEGRFTRCGGHIVAAFCLPARA